MYCQGKNRYKKGKKGKKTSPKKQNSPSFESEESNPIYFTDTDSESDTTPLAKRARQTRKVRSTSPTTKKPALPQPFSLVPTKKPSKKWNKSGMSLNFSYSPTTATPDSSEPEETTNAG